MDIPVNIMEELIKNVDILSGKVDLLSKSLGIPDGSIDNAGGQAQGESVLTRINKISERVDILSQTLGTPNAISGENAQTATISQTIASMGEVQSGIKAGVVKLNAWVDTYPLYGMVEVLLFGFVLLFCLLARPLKNAKRITRIEKSLKDFREDYLKAESERQKKPDTVTKQELESIIDSHMSRLQSGLFASILDKLTPASGNGITPPPEQRSYPLHIQHMQQVMDVLATGKYPLQELKETSEYRAVKKFESGVDGEAAVNATFLLKKDDQQSKMCLCFTLSISNITYLYPNDPHNYRRLLNEWFSESQDRSQWAPAWCKWDNGRLVLLKKGIMPR